MSEALDFEQAAEFLLKNPFFLDLSALAMEDKDFRARCESLTELNDISGDEGVSSERWYQVVAEAYEDTKAFDILNEALGERIFNELPLTEEMRFWLYLVLTGDRERPKAKGGHNRRSTEIWRKTVADCVYLAIGCGLRPTRNAASEPKSACDAVVEAFACQGFHTTYATVARAWNKYKPSDSDLFALRSLQVAYDKP